MNHPGRKGAIAGFLIGSVALAGAFVVAVRCLPFHISLPTRPWPWYCSDPAYHVIGHLAFPVNLLTNDLSQAILLAPLSLLLYTTFGALLGLARGSSKRRVRR